MPPSILTPGARLGPYEIVSALGAGGMGEVYRAHDTKLNRDVAIKVLLAAVANDRDRLARFSREAQVLASLNHPNIAHIHGIEESDGVTALVLELVEGEDLAHRIARGPLPLDEALPIAKQLAAALEAAHEQGIIHRDLKPANIKVRPDGTVKVLDFGLAKAMEPVSARASSVSMSATLTTPAMTQAGMILGTAAYMSPEQARGSSLDKRADLWAFGVVLYEMLTGMRLFEGATVSDTLASVLKSAPDWTTLPSTTPAPIRRLLRRCLEKDRTRRLPDAVDIRLEIEDALTAPAGESAGATASSSRVSSRLAWLIAAASVAIAAIVIFMRAAPAGDADPFPMRMEIADAAGALAGANVTRETAAALSPDGYSIVFSARSPSGRGTTLYLRRLDQLTAHAVPGTSNPGRAVFSPDGKWIAYVAGRNTIVKVPLDGGAPIPLATVPDGGGIDWSSRDDIVVGNGTMEGLKGLFRVSAAGGALVPVTQVDVSRKELSHQWPRVLEDGRTVLFTIWFGTVEQAQLAAASMDDGKVVPLGITGTQVLGVVGGTLVYTRADGVAMAVPFDVRSLRASGVAVPVQDSIRMSGGNSGTGAANAFLTHAGGLVFSRGAARRRLVWVDRTGNASPLLANAREFESVRLSPDGRQAAVGITTGTKSDLWVLDIAASTLTPLTTTGTTRNPSWSPDGRRILYASTHSGRSGLWWQPADGSGPAVMAGEPRHNPWWVDLSPDGRTAIFNAVYDGSWNVESLSLDASHESRDLAASSTAMEVQGRFAPDGHSVAYHSNESGRPEVYVRPFPETGSRVQISANGGRRPIWAPDGKRIYFWEEDRLISATLARDPALRVVSRETMFEGRYADDFDITKDGTRFLMIESESSGVSLVIVPNWATELHRLTATRKSP